MSAYLGNALAGLASPSSAANNQLAPARTMPGGNRLAPRTSPAFPGDTRHMEPLPPGFSGLPVNDGLPPPPSAPVALVGQPPPAPTAPASLSSIATPGQVAQYRRTIGSLPSAALATLAGNQAHYVDALSTLLTRRGDITDDDLKGAINAALDRKKATKEQAAAFEASLPPTSDQGALRAALNGVLRRSVHSAIETHAEAQRRGLDLPGMMQEAGNGA